MTEDAHCQMSCRRCHLRWDVNDPEPPRCKTSPSASAVTDLPRLALSVRQPWAWAIVFAGKDIENRSWSCYSSNRRFRGRCAIHASAGMTRYEYTEASEFMASVGITCPSPAELARGAIIGTVEVIDGITKRAPAASSRWFFGPFGLVLRDPEPLSEPLPVSGQLGFFEWQPTEGGKVSEPAKWMLPKQTTNQHEAPGDDIFKKGAA